MRRLPLWAKSVPKQAVCGCKTILMERPKRSFVQYRTMCYWVFVPKQVWILRFCAGNTSLSGNTSSQQTTNTQYRNEWALALKLCHDVIGTAPICFQCERTQTRGLQHVLCILKVNIWSDDLSSNSQVTWEAFRSSRIFWSLILSHMSRNK